MNRLQIRLFGPDFSSFSAHSFGYELSNEPKSGLKHPNFRFGPNSPTASWAIKARFPILRQIQPFTIVTVTDTVIDNCVR